MRSILNAFDHDHGIQVIFSLPVMIIATIFVSIPLVVRAMKLARHRKAGTVAITDATLSEVAKLAQIRLYYSSNSPAYVRSHTALLSLIQALAYGVYAQDSAQYDDRIKAFRLK